MKTEIWKDVVGYSGLYSVSDQGRVKSHWYSNTRILVQSIAGGKYRKLTLSKDGTYKSFTVHILVMSAFKGERPEGYDISHKDGCGSNNNLCNLEYTTHKDNINKKHEHGTMAKGETNGMSSLTEIKVCAMRLLYSTGRYTFTEIGKMFNIHKGTANRAITGQSWSHV